MFLTSTVWLSPRPWVPTPPRPRYVRALPSWQPPDTQTVHPPRSPAIASPLVQRLRKAMMGGIPQTKPTLQERALAGDRAAWNLLIAQHTPRVRAFLMARGVARPRAEDLCQETWLRLVRAADEGRLDRVDLPGLALTQARYLLLQRANTTREALLDDWPPRTADLTPDPEVVAGDREQLAAVRAAVEALSPRARQVFERVYTQHMSAAEAARDLDMSVQRVRQSLCESRKRLRLAVTAAPTVPPGGAR